MFLSGATVGATLQFFQTSFNDSAVQRMHRSLDTCCSVVETLAVTHLARACEQLLHTLHCLRGELSCDGCLEQHDVSDCCDAMEDGADDDVDVTGTRSNGFALLGWTYHELSDLIDGVEAFMVQASVSGSCCGDWSRAHHFVSQFVSVNDAAIYLRSDVREIA